MFRKIINIILAAVLLISTTGFTISKHYCGTRLVNIAINHEAKSCCDGPSKCCHNEIRYFQVNDDFSPSIINFNFEIFESLKLFPVYFVLKTFFSNNIIETTYFNTESQPPGIIHIPIFNQSFLL